MNQQFYSKTMANNNKLSFHRQATRYFKKDVVRGSTQRCLIELKKFLWLGIKETFPVTYSYARNIRTMAENSRLLQVERLFTNYKLEILGLSGVRWMSGEHTTPQGNVLLYSGMADKRMNGVGIMLSKATRRSLIDWNPVSDRIITARIRNKVRNVNIVQCYAPTDPDEEEAKNAFYLELTRVMCSLHKGEIHLVMRVFNAQVGHENG